MNPVEIHNNSVCVGVANESPASSYYTGSSLQQVTSDKHIQVEGRDLLRDIIF